jgi:hypothetical protein
VVGNVATANLVGIRVRGAVSLTTNAASINRFEGFNFSLDFSGVFTRNNMFANDCGVFSDTSTLKATNNYWGVATGPGAPPADDICGAGATTTPFATKPFIVKPLKP